MENESARHQRNRLNHALQRRRADSNRCHRSFARLTTLAGGFALAGVLYWLAVAAPHAAGPLAERDLGRSSEGAHPPVLRTAEKPPPARSASRHYRVSWALYQREHHLSTRLGARLRAAQRRIRQLERTHVRRTQAHDAVADWRARQIHAAEVIGREALAAGLPDPWPKCPDPIRDGAASWDVTVECENGGSWLDSPGFFRCGLQFDPSWERRFGPLCP